MSKNQWKQHWQDFRAGRFYRGPIEFYAFTLAAMLHGRGLWRKGGLGPMKRQSYTARQWKNCGHYAAGKPRQF